MTDKELLQEMADLMDLKLKPINERLDKVEQGQTALRSEMNERFDVIDKRLDEIQSDLDDAWEDVATAEKRIKKHEKEFHNVG